MDVYRTSKSMTQPLHSQKKIHVSPYHFPYDVPYSRQKFQTIQPDFTSLSQQFHSFIQDHSENVKTCLKYNNTIWPIVTQKDKERLRIIGSFFDEAIRKEQRYPPFRFFILEQLRQRRLMPPKAKRACIDDWIFICQLLYMRILAKNNIQIQIQINDRLQDFLAKLKS